MSRATSHDKTTIVVNQISGDADGELIITGDVDALRFRV
jgi:hypothetical protein